MPRGALSDRDFNQKVNEIRTSLADTRELKFATEVPVLIQNKESIKKSLESYLIENYGEQKLEDLSLAYATLGLLPQGFDLKKSLLNLYANAIAGFYNSKSKKVVLLHDSDGATPAGIHDSATDFDTRDLVHELTHALQDQHFSLEKWIRPSDNDDKALAFRAIAEGDALLTELSFLFGGSQEVSLDQATQDLDNGTTKFEPTLFDLPAVIADKLIFQYKAGAAFVHRLLKAGGWSAINLLYSYPPLSTEQVLHPGKYFEHPDPPIRIELSDLSTLYTPDWRQIENNSLGELMVQCLFKEFFSVEEAKEIANGWGGDRFIAFRRGDEVSFVWATVWDTPRDAEKFVKKYEQLLLKKSSSPSRPTSQTHLERRDLTVIVVHGLDKSTVSTNIENLWQGMKLVKEPFQNPFRSMVTGSSVH